MRAVVINLDHAERRLARFDQLACSAGVKIERIAAVDGRDPGNFALLDRHRSFLVNDTIISNTDMACALSHRKAWRALIDSGENWLAVFEDDIHFGAGLAELLDERWIGDGVQLVKLESHQDSARIGAVALCEVGGRKLHRLLGGNLGTAGYLVSRRAAQPLLDLTEKMDFPLDSIMFGERCAFMLRTEVHQIVPAAVIQDMILAHRTGRAVDITTSMVRPAAERRPFHLDAIWKLKKNLAKLFYFMNGLFAQAGPIAEPCFVPFE